MAPREICLRDCAPGPRGAACCTPWAEGPVRGDPLRLAKHGRFDSGGDGIRPAVIPPELLPALAVRLARGMKFFGDSAAGIFAGGGWGSGIRSGNFFPPQRCGSPCRFKSGNACQRSHVGVFSGSPRMRGAGSDPALGLPSSAGGCWCGDGCGRSRRSPWRLD